MFQGQALQAFTATLSFTIKINLLLGNTNIYTRTNYFYRSMEKTGHLRPNVITTDTVTANKPVLQAPQSSWGRNRVVVATHGQEVCQE